jgi:hypothetical protein
MVKLLGKTSSIQGKKKVLGMIHKTSLLLECTQGTPDDGLINRKCTGVINLFCETYLVLFSFNMYFLEGYAIIHLI